MVGNASFIPPYSLKPFPSRQSSRIGDAGAYAFYIPGIVSQALTPSR